MNLGISGRITRAFIRSPLTPLFLLAAVAMGAVALFALAREEEPQISVPMVDILVSANGLKAVDAVGLVTKPLEDVVKSIDDVEHVYSQTRDDQVAVTLRFNVGTDQDTAILRVHEKIRAGLDRLPHGVPEPLIIGRGINDVPIVVVTLSPKPGFEARWDDNGLYQIADQLLPELMKVPNTGLNFMVGGRPNQIRIEPSPEKLALYGVTLSQLAAKIENANRSFVAGAVRETNREIPVVAGQTLQGIADIGMLLLTTRDGRAVYVKDVANVVIGAAPAASRVWQVDVSPGGEVKTRPAVSIALAKRKGANAVEVSRGIIRNLERLHGSLIPGDIQIDINRDYGETANEKADELLFHLALATVSIVVLITLVVGWREGLVVMVVIPTTILLTLFASYLMGFTINRVSLFALIFSIGILVDDAIVVVENIVRHWQMKDGRSVVQKAVEGVAEVGNPTIVATSTIVAALLPMMFVSGLMGPYMSPIPANASAAMVFSFFVAVILTPWLLVVLAGGKAERMAEEDGGHQDHEGAMGRLYRRVAAWLLVGRRRATVFLAIVGVATVGVCVLFYTRDVTVKLLPFDNKSELQIVVDLPEGSTLESTERVLMGIASRLKALPEMTSLQAYVGTASPFNFSGLVRHTYLRKSPHMGDLQINLTPKDHRDRTSHQVALDVRGRLKGLDVPPGTRVKVSEVPPGPPVLSTLIAEIYGPDDRSRRAAADKVKQAFSQVEDIVDVDDSFGHPNERLRFAIEQEALEFHGVQEGAVYDTLKILLDGVTAGYSHRGNGSNPVEIAVRQPKDALFPGERLLATPIPAPGPAGDQGRVVELGDVVTMTHEPASYPIFRRNGHYTEMITAEMAGRFEAPIYGMLAVEKVLAAMDWGAGGRPLIRYHGQPEDESTVSLLWDGEWEITYITFRDMGAAFAVAILAIYLLVVGQFGSFKLPLVILVPVPLTLIGILLGHWAFGAPFTATSMIGFIALAGIIVRNSILLVDFINHLRAGGGSLRACLIDAGAIRFKPIFLTAVAAIIGAAFILADPIFQGLAISMVFGLASSTALTLLVIPALYVCLRDDGRE